MLPFSESLVIPSLFMVPSTNFLSNTTLPNRNLCSELPIDPEVCSVHYEIDSDLVVTPQPLNASTPQHLNTSTQSNHQLNGTDGFVPQVTNIVVGPSSSSHTLVISFRISAFNSMSFQLSSCKQEETLQRLNASTAQQLNTSTAQHLNSSLNNQNKPRIEGSLSVTDPLRRIKKPLRSPRVYTRYKKTSCHCKRTRCIKRYCECFSKGFPCSSNCGCKDCGNIRR